MLELGDLPVLHEASQDLAVKISIVRNQRRPGELHPVDFGRVLRDGLQGNRLSGGRTLVLEILPPCDGYTELLGVI